MTNEKIRASLFDYEQKLLNEFVKQKNRTAEEVDEFLNILFQLRERPDKNPLLKRMERKK